jgi:hypothetical protein
MNLRLLFLSIALCATSSKYWSQVDSTNVNDSLANTIPLFVIDQDEGDDNESQAQNISGLLQSSRDVYVKQVGFNFSFARFRMRGYDSDFTNVFIQGISANDPETGMAIWAYWGGLNDITRYPEIGNGITSNQVTFGGPGGYSSISLRASQKRKGTRVSYAATNRTYTNRLMVTHSTGWNSKGWAFSFSLSGRYSNEGYVDGTSFNGMSYFAAAEKKLSDNHTVNFAVLGAPTVQARSGIAIQEAYDLTGNNYYNPYWGYQTTADGEQVKRNARVRDNHVPYMVLSDELKINSKSKLTNSVYYSFGRTGNTNLNWNNAADPRPDYYRNFPSYSYSRDQDDFGNQATALWTANDPSTTQLDWDFMYFANGKNLSTVQNANGSGEALTGNRAKYIVEEYRVDPRRLGFNSVYVNQLSDKLNLAVGANAYSYVSRNYRVLKDLLGSDFWLDVDQFAERDFSDPVVAQNDLTTPNKIIKVGDTFGYDYDMHVNYADVFGNLDFKIGKRIDGFAGLDLNTTTFWRDGNLRNGKFPDNSEGESEKQKFFNYGLKGGLVYKINGRHALTVNALHQTKAPNVRNSYISPRTRDKVIDNLGSSEITSGDINYVVRYPKFQARASAFYTVYKNQIWSRSFYHDEYLNFVNYMMTGVDKLYQGIELGLEGNVTSTIVLSGAFTTAEYLYTSRPSATVTVDNSEELVADNKTIYLKNYRVGGIPQTAMSVGIKYNSPKYWFIGVNGNYVMDLYLDPNPDRRTEQALAGFVESDPQVAQIIDQEKLANGYNVNLFAGYSYRLKGGQFIRFNINVNNLTNNKSFISGGFEQLRYDVANINKFPSRYGYGFGLSYFAQISFQF